MSERDAPRRCLAVVAACVVTAMSACAYGSSDESQRERARAVGPPKAVPRATVDRFDGARAFAEARRQVELGPRPAASAASRRLARRLAEELPHGRLERVAGGLQNVVGHVGGRLPAIVVAAHYDTKALPGFVGANDGAAGSAVVVELARALARVRPQSGAQLRFVLFDGEENPDDRVPFYEGGLRGSKAYVRRHRGEVRELILLDFVGDRQLSLPRENGSDPRLWKQLRESAERVGVGAVFPGRSVGEVIDDHTPFTRAGIPAIDLIDIDYPHFHRPSDTLDKISPTSLDAVGEAVVELVASL